VIVQRPQPQQSPYATPSLVARQPDRSLVVPAAVAAGSAAAAAAQLAGAGPVATIVAGAGAGAATAGAMLLRGEAVADSTPIPTEWCVRDAADGARIMTWNIRGAAGSWGGRMRAEVRDDIVAAIERIDPDVVVMQEVDRRSPRSTGRDLAAQLAERTGATDWAFAYRRAGRLGTEFGAYGHLVLTRNGYEIEDDATGADRTFALPLVTTAGIQRIADVSSITTPDGGSFTMVGTHLSSGNPQLRDRQLVELGAAVDAIRAGTALSGLRQRHANVPAQSLPSTVVLAGDFNAQPTTLRRAGSLEPEARDLVDALSSAGVPLRDPRRVSYVGGASLDHLFVTPDARVAAASILHAPRGSWDDGIRRHWPSEHTADHDALVADVVLPPRT
jgi:endonuclease/exonuclease/phosphatase family metal-dependent hydrolase